MQFYDAHNHLQDDRFANRDELMAACRRENIARMVVNGAAEGDWGAVAQLGATYAEVLPSFGYHPWYVRERTPEWLEELTARIDRRPSAIGEIGLDRWKPDVPYDGQEEVFLAQLNLAAERNLPASIHCLKAWGRLYDLLREHRRPARGFLLHSFGGPHEMVRPLAKLGAYFSFPGYYTHPRKERQRETFKHVPPDRLLIESDAPDQMPSADWRRYPLVGPDSQPLNHPANLSAIYEALAQILEEPLDSLASRVEENFLRLFGES